MVIRDLKDCTSALNEISMWLQKGDFNEVTFGEISSTIAAVESYMGIQLPAKEFIVSNCSV